MKCIYEDGKKLWMSIRQFVKHLIPDRGRERILGDPPKSNEERIAQIEDFLGELVELLNSKDLISDDEVLTMLNVKHRYEIKEDDS